MTRTYHQMIQRQSLFATDDGVYLSQNTPMAKDKRVGLELKALRTEAGFSSRGFADAIQINAASYGYYENRYKKRLLPPEMMEAILPVLTKAGIKKERVLALGGELQGSQALEETTDTAELADQLAELVRLFSRIKNPRKRALRMQMIVALLSEDEEDNGSTLANPSGPTASRRS